MTAAKGVSNDDRKFLSDQYRVAAFNLARAARVLRDTTEQLSQTRVRVAPAALVDLGEARRILRELPDAQSTKVVDK
jgi:hypothetical protein